MYTHPMAQRMNESGEGLINVGLKVAAATKADLLDVGVREDRPMGYIARKMVLRGLAAYRRDGLLDEPRSASAQPAVIPEEPGVFDVPLGLQMSGPPESDEDKKQRDFKRVLDDDPLKPK